MTSPFWFLVSLILASVSSFTFTFTFTAAAAAGGGGVQVVVVVDLLLDSPVGGTLTSDQTQTVESKQASKQRVRGIVGSWHWHY